MATVLIARRSTLVCLWTAWLLLAAAAARAQELPTLTQPVNDFANVIDAGSEAELDRRIRALQRTTGDVVIVTTVDTFAPYGSIEEYAVRLFERAGIGKRGQDNGLLILVAVKDRRARIEVGYDLEQFVTDGFAGDTIRQMLPAFRDGRYGAGLVGGTTRVIRRISEGRGQDIPDVPPPAAAPPSTERDTFPWFPIVVIVIVIALRLMRIGGGPPGMYGRRRRRTWSGWSTGVGGFGGGWMGGGFGGGGFGGGGGGGGFGGFGGGRSGGGGASGGW